MTVWTFFIFLYGNQYIGIQDAPVFDSRTECVHALIEAIDDDEIEVKAGTVVLCLPMPKSEKS
jgi:hypothetical protein